MARSTDEEYRSRVRGCLLGGAIGDALGGPVEFDDARTIVASHPDLVRTFVAGGPDWPAGTVTDDTQMTLFTVEGLIRAGVRTDRGLGFTVAVVHHAYDRWLDTQLLPEPSGERDGWLQAEQWLYARRAPGNTCLSALKQARGDGDKIPQFGGQAANNSKGCGGVMRAAPFGLLPHGTVEWAFDASAEAGAYTHGHVTGKLASGALAAIVHELRLGRRPEHRAGQGPGRPRRAPGPRRDQYCARIRPRSRHDRPDSRPSDRGTARRRPGPRVHPGLATARRVRPGDRLAPALPRLVSRRTTAGTSGPSPEDQARRPGRFVVPVVRPARWKACGGTHYAGPRSL